MLSWIDSLRRTENTRCGVSLTSDLRVFAPVSAAGEGLVEEAVEVIVEGGREKVDERHCELD